MNRHLVRLEIIMVTISCQACQFFAVRECYSISDISTSVFCYYKTNALAVRTSQFPIGRLICLPRDQQKCFSLEAAPVEDSSSPRKFNFISFKGPVCHPSDSLLAKYLPISCSWAVFSACEICILGILHTNFSNFFMFNVIYTNKRTSHRFFTQLALVISSIWHKSCEGNMKENVSS